jgi:hypothetical protein
MVADVVTAPRPLSLKELEATPWASCGPAALAALLERPLASIRDAFPNNTATRTWTTLQMMDRALAALGVRHSATPWALSLESAKQWPRRGVVLIQFRGGWDAMPVDHAAQLQRSHWIAVKPRGEQSAVFDVNAVEGSGILSWGWWQPRKDWERVCAPALAAGFGKKATGAWWVRAGFEIALPEGSAAR